MSVRVRFAPSPTGYLHIGGARTCLYNYLYAKKMGGKLVVRVEDTDQERSSREFEESQMNDLKWLGIEWDEGPGKDGEFGPYRQSERMDIYQKYADQLLEEGKAFYCFCTDEELEQMREKAIAENRDPIYDGTWRDFPLEEARKKIEAGEKASIRFTAPLKDYTFTDQVRGEVTFPKGMVGDFVILRSNGMPTFNFCVVVDDLLMKITHVIRGEDHLNNMVRQLMVYEALGAETPEFAHVSLLIGNDRQKLSKRHGATSVSQYREQNYLPEAMNNYLTLLGWSHPEEVDIFTKEEITNIFGLERFSKSAALYDIEKLKWVNGQHLKKLPPELISNSLEKLDSSAIKESFSSQTPEWKTEFTSLFLEKVQVLEDYVEFLKAIFNGAPSLEEDAKEVLSWETTPVIKSLVQENLKSISGEYLSKEDLSSWMNTLKKEHKIKGKNLFMGLRVVLTGMCHGSDLTRLIPLTPVKVIQSRVEKLD